MQNYKLWKKTRQRASPPSHEILAVESGHGFRAVCFPWDRTGSRTSANGCHWVSRAGTTEVPLMEERTGTGRGRPGAASWTPSILFSFSPEASPGQGQRVMDVHRETGQQNAHFIFLRLEESNNEVFLLVQWQSWGVGPTDLPASSSLPPQPTSDPQPCTPFRYHVREGPALLEPLLHCLSGPPLVHTNSRGRGEWGGMGPLTCPHVAVLQSSHFLCVLWAALWGLWTGDTAVNQGGTQSCHPL